MHFHRNAKLGLAGRHALVLAIEGGMTPKEAAVSFSVSPATAHRWWHRWRQSDDEGRRTRSCLRDRSSRPLRNVVALCLNPPEAAVVLCVEEKSQIQALDRSAPVLPLMPGVPARHTHDYVRNGSTNLCALVRRACQRINDSGH